MFSKIQDLPRFHSDQQRFKIAIDAQDNKADREEGERLLADLISSVEVFDGAMTGLVKGGDKRSRVDHATAQERVKECKEAIEHWVQRHAPNVHVEEISSQ
jgi:hypothetical protein